MGVRYCKLIYSGAYRVYNHFLKPSVASRHVAFLRCSKIALSVVFTREKSELPSSLDDEEVLEDSGYSADLYIFLIRTTRWIGLMFISVNC